MVLPEPEPIEIVTEDGFSLRGEVQLPDGACAAACVLGHAMWVDRRTMDRPPGRGLMSTMLAHGIACLRFDARGHGQSTPHPRHGARFAYDHYVLYDAPAMVRAGRDRFGELPLGLLGHSLMGHAAMIAAGLFPERAPDALIGLGANLWLPRFESSRSRRLLKTAALGLWLAASYPRGHFDAKAWGLGSTGVPALFVEQYLRCWRRGRFETMDGRHDLIAALGDVRVPVLSVSSQGDRVMGDPANVSAFARNIPSRWLEEWIVDASMIDPPPGHMALVTSERSRPLWERLARWLLEHAGARTMQAAGGPPVRPEAV
ncbi:MAG: alpha/beta fold hydrolase [Myxococcales bacterium]|nr:alpha/beta fold hydrolase [Myxococcales bacterium]